MKKVLMLSWCLVLCICLLAQQRVAKNDVRQETVSVNQPVFGKEVATESAVPFMPLSANSVVVNRFQDLEEATTMWTTYDLQSNQYCSNRMYQLSNGSVGVTATMSHQYNQTASDRGTGYNFYNGSYWQNQPNTRIENFKTGWPTIAQWGSNGEILICHGNSHLQCYTRSTVGQGQWVYKGELPDYPASYPYAGASDAYPTWARVVTSGNNHNIIHVVACIKHSISSDESVNHQVYFRSTDAVNWTVSYSPLASLGYETGYFSADNYCMAANGHTVAILYSGSILNSTWLFKSTDDGMTWEPRRVWQDPYEAQNGVAYTEELYRPMNGSVVIDNNGVCHVALNTFLMMIDEAAAAEGSYFYQYGRTVDGILYWNDTEEGPIQAKDGNPHNAARLWWPIPDDPAYVHMEPDSTRWIGFIPVYLDEDGIVIQWDNDKFYHASTDYYQIFYGASGHPALSCDPQGNLACAFSSPCMLQEDPSAPYYYRHIYVSYRNVNNGYWNQLVDDITHPEEVFELSQSDNLFTISAPNTVNNGEFWFGFQSDNEIGLYWGSNAQQSSASENNIYVMKVQADPEFVGVATNYTISVSANPTNGGIVTGGGTYAQGSTCILQATPNSGYSFVKWTKNGSQVSTNPNYSFTVTGNASYVAHFQQSTTTYSITATANPTNGGTVSGSGTYASGSTCTLLATPNNGYSFEKWTKNGSQVSTNPNYSFTVTGNASYVAHFQQSTTTYTITATANPTNGGTVSGGGTYASGSTCTLFATPNSGYSFEKWTKNGSQISTNPSYSFTVTGNATYVAHFQQITTTYTITVTANPTNGGTVSGSGTYASGSTCTLLATPNSGYSFEKWTKNGSQVSTNPNYSFTVTGNATYEAHFSAIPQEFTITASADPANGGAVSGGGTYAAGSTCVLSAMPNSGFVFENWTRGDSGIVVSTEPSYSFVVNRNGNYVAHFIQSANHVTITAMANPVDGGAISGCGTYELGSTCTLNAIAAVGYEFVKWTLNGSQVSTQPSFSFTVTINAVYTAHFDRIVNHYTIAATVEPTTAGSISGTGTYLEGTTCTLTATANQTYSFVNWMESGVIVSTNPTYSFTVNNDRNLVATFSQGLFFTITASTSGDGTISPEGVVYVEPGQDKTFAMIPNSGSRVGRVVVDGVDIGAVDSYTFRSVNSNHTIYVQFSGVGVDENQNENLKVYPNPTKEYIIVEGEDMKQIAVFNLLGVQMASQEVNDSHTTLNTSGFIKGTYLLKVEYADGKIGYSRFVVAE